MYAEFGSKRELSEAELERYSEQNLTRVLAPIEAKDADADTIRTAFEDYVSASTGAFSGLGCLMCNTAVERAALDPGSGRLADAYLKRLADNFRNALGNAQRKGQVADAADLDAMTGFFAMSLVGISALIRTKAAPEQVQSAARIATAVLRTAV